MAIESAAFAQSMERECRRDMLNVYTNSGILKVTPIRAINMHLEAYSAVFVRIIYGDDERCTTSVSTHNKDLIWVEEEDIKSEGTKHLKKFVQAQDVDGNETTGLQSLKALPESSGEENVAKCTEEFEVELQNVRSDLKIELVGTTKFWEQAVLATMKVPIFNILDKTQTCIEGPDGFLFSTPGVKGGVEPQYYEAWFPMSTEMQNMPADGNSKYLLINSHFEESDYSRFSEKMPCLKLRLAWSITGTRTDKAKTDLKLDSSDGKEVDPQRIDSSEMYARVQLPYASIAIIDSVRTHEIMRVSFFGLEQRLMRTNRYSDASLNLTWLQVDNQLDHSLRPVIVAPTAIKYPQPTLRVHIRRNNMLTSADLSSFDTIQIVLQTLDIGLEQAVVTAITMFYHNLHVVSKIIGKSSAKNLNVAINSGTSSVMVGHSTPTDHLNVNSVADPQHVPNTDSQEYNHCPVYTQMPLAAGGRSCNDNLPYNHNLEMTYIGFMNISPIKLNISLLVNPNLRDSGVFLEDKKSKRGIMFLDAAEKSVMTSLQYFFSMVGEVTLEINNSVTDSVISFPIYEGGSVFETTEELGKRLRSYYMYGALTQLYNVVGSLEMVGNPIGLVNSMGSGVKDFFFEPSNALITNPTQVTKFGKGVVKGTLSLVSNTAEGVIGTGTAITRQFSKGLAKLSMDQEYNSFRDEINLPARSLGDAAIKPIWDIIYGLYYGVTGIVVVPYKNWRRYRLRGLPKGFAMGLAGLASKPVVGVLDAATHTGEAVRRGIHAIQRDLAEPLYRVDFSCQFGPDGRLLTSSFTTALGVEALHAVDNINRDGVGFGLDRATTTVWSTMEAFFSCLSPKAVEDHVNESGGEVREADSLNKDLTRNEDEFVIYTAAVPAERIKFSRRRFKKMKVVIQLIIVTNKRLLVVEYLKHRNKSATFTLQWNADLTQLYSPELQVGTDGALSILLKARPQGTQDEECKGIEDTNLFNSYMLPDHKLSKHKVESFSCTFNGDITECYNCIEIVRSNGKVKLGSLHVIYSPQGEVILGPNIVLDGEAVYRIGDWEFYSNDSGYENLEEDNYRVESEKFVLNFNDPESKHTLNRVVMPFNILRSKYSIPQNVAHSSSLSYRMGQSRSRADSQDSGGIFDRMRGRSTDIGFFSERTPTEISGNFTDLLVPGVENTMINFSPARDKEGKEGISNPESPWAKQFVNINKINDVLEAAGETS